MKVKGYEVFKCDAGWRTFSFLKLTTDDGIIGWSEFNESFGSVGLSDVIVDLVSTGSTLRANNLVEVEHIMDISSRLVVNQAALKMKRERLQPIVEAYREYRETLRQRDESRALVASGAALIDGIEPVTQAEVGSPSIARPTRTMASPSNSKAASTATAFSSTCRSKAACSKRSWPSGVGLKAWLILAMEPAV